MITEETATLAKAEIVKRELANASAYQLREWAKETVQYRVDDFSTDEIIQNYEEWTGESIGRLES